MPLHLNLYHEIVRQKAASRRDPLKIAAYILGFIVAIFVAMYVVELSKNASIHSELSKLKAEFDTLDPKSKEIERSEKALKATLDTSGLFVKNIEGRFYWAPTLQEVIKVVPREVQITRFTGNVATNGVIVPAGSPPPAATDTTKKATILLEGIACGADPRRVAEDLRQALTETFGKKYKTTTASFKQLDDSPDTVTIEGRNLPTATFGIILTLEGANDAAATATNTPR